MEQEQREKEKERMKGGCISSTLDSIKNKGMRLHSIALTIIENVFHVLYYLVEVQTLDTIQALCLPLGASISLLVMFFFFDSMQMLFAICTASKYRFVTIE